MACIEKLPHNCGSSDGLQVFEEDGKYTGFCFACDTYVSDPYGDKPPEHKPVRIQKSEEEIDADLAFIHKSLHTVANPKRKLDQATLEYFGVKAELSQVDGVTPTVYYFPFYSGSDTPAAYKAKLAQEKRMWVVGRMKGVQMFGWPQALNTGAKRLFITEGEEDACALWQVLVEKNKGTQWADYYPAVVSLTNGASGAVNNIVEQQQEINTLFSEVVLVFDQDEAGKKACQEVNKVFPKATVATIPCKDANACLMEGRKIALANAVLFKTGDLKNTRLVVANSLHEAARKPAEHGLSWPWKQMDKFTRGIRFGETYYVGAGVKMGKSEFVNALAAHLLTEHGLKVFLAKPEEANNKTYKMVASKIVGKFFHDPTKEFDYDAYDKAGSLIGDKLILLDLWQHMGWKTLRQDIITAANNGCKAIFIDPITNMINGIDSGQANTILQDIAQDLAVLAKDLDVVIFIFCHLKAPDSGPPHERGGKVQSYQFSGSRAMMRSCNYMIGIEGDKDPDKSIEERNIRKIVMLEDREFGTSGYFRVYWDENTGMFVELEA